MKKPTKKPAKQPAKKLEVLDEADVFAGRLLTADELGRFAAGLPLVPLKPEDERN